MADVPISPNLTGGSSGGAYSDNTAKIGNYVYAVAGNGNIFLYALLAIGAVYLWKRVKK